MRLLASNQIEKNAGWGAEWFLDAGFRSIGCDVVNVDYKVHQFSLTRAFARVADQSYDGFFLQRGDFFPHDVLAAMPTPRVFWGTELVSRRPDQWPNLRTDLFDFVYVRSIPCREAVIEKGWKSPERVAVLSSGFSGDVFRPLPAVEKDIDVLFVGSPMPRRDAIMDEISKVIPITRARAYGAKMNELFNRARIVLNLHSEDFPDTETRVYEALGSGAFLLTESLSAENPFEVGVDLAVADGIDNLVEAVRYYLDHGTERRRIAESGHHAAQNHTYAARAATIVGRFESLRQDRCLQDGPPRDRVDVVALRAAAWKEPVRAVRWAAHRGAFRIARKTRHLLKKLKGYGLWPGLGS